MEEMEGRSKYRRGEVAQNLFIILLLAVGLYLLVPRLVGVPEMLDVIRHANFFVLPFALAVEALSMLSICFLYFELQREGGGRLTFGRTSLIFMSAYAFGHIVPGGNAGTFYLNYVEMRREGLSRTQTVKVLTAANLFYSGAMLCLIITGLLVSLVYPGLSHGYRLTALLVAAGLLAFLVACLLLIRNEALLGRLARRLVRGLRRLGAWKEREEDDLVANIMEVRRFFYALITHRDSLVRNGFYALGFWCMDMACLFIMFIAVGTPVNAGIVIIAYALADLVGSLPLTPAGLGTFEVTMGAVFYAYGYPKAALVAAVLGFRFFSYWLCTLAGGVCYLFLRRERRKERQLGKT
jgi:putative heme transporter